MAVTDEQLAASATVREEQRSWADDPNDPSGWEDVVIVTTMYRRADVSNALALPRLVSGALGSDAARALGQPVADAIAAKRGGGE